MVKISCIVFCFLTAVTRIGGQTVVEQYDRLPDSLRVAASQYVPYNEAGYTLLLPESGEVTGLLVSIEERRFDLDPADRRALIHPAAMAAELGVLYLSTGKPVDLFLEPADLPKVHQRLRDVLLQHGLDRQPIVFFGSMTAGHRALKYQSYLQRHEPEWRPDVRGVAVAEAPLDWVRMWYEGEKQRRDSLTEVKRFEGELILTLFADAWGVTPREDPDRYARFSTYSYFDTSAAARDDFANIAIRAYTYMPVNHWVTPNGNNVYDCNYPDMVGLINEQALVGNDAAVLIASGPEEAGVSHAMKKQTDTWLEVSKTELVDWAKNLMRSPP